MSIMQALQLALSGGQAGLSLAGQQQAEETYMANMEAVLNAGKMNAERAMREGRIQQYEYEYKAAQLEGATLASMASRGGDFSGSNVDVLAMQEANNRFNLDLIMYQAGLKARNELMQTRNTLESLTTGIESQRLKTTGQILGIASSAYDRFNQGRYTKNIMNIQAANAREEQAARARGEMSIVDLYRPPSPKVQSEPSLINNTRPGISIGE